MSTAGLWLAAKPSQPTNLLRQPPAPHAVLSWRQPGPQWRAPAPGCRPAGAPHPALGSGTRHLVEAPPRHLLHVQAQHRQVGGLKGPAVDGTWLRCYLDWRGERVLAGLQGNQKRPPEQLLAHELLCLLVEKMSLGRNPESCCPSSYKHWDTVPYKRFSLPRHSPCSACCTSSSACCCSSVAAWGAGASAVMVSRARHLSRALPRLR